MIDDTLDVYVLYISRTDCEECSKDQPSVARAADNLDVDYHVIDENDPQYDEFVETLGVEIAPTVVFCDGRDILLYEGRREIARWIENTY